MALMINIVLQMMWLPLVMLASWGAVLSNAQSDDNYCLARDPYPYLYFGPKTAYERVYDHKDSPQNVPCELPQIPLCDPCISVCGPIRSFDPP